MGTTNLDSLSLGGNLTVTGTETITGGVTYAGAVTLGDAAGDAITVNGTTTALAPITVGVDDTGHDVKFFGATTAKSWLWDESADKMIVTGASDLLGNTQQTGTFTVGVNDTGYDVQFFGATAGKSFLWDESADSLIITSAVATALVVGANGGTNPALTVDASTASSATGLSVKSAAAAGGLALAVTSSGTNENLTINAKGSGTITLGGTSTGNIVLGRAATGVSISTTGIHTSLSGTAVPATAGAVAAGAPYVANSNGMTIEWTTDAPTHTRPKGSVCFNLGGSSASTRAYVNTDGAGTWTSITTAA